MNFITKEILVQLPSDNMPPKITIAGDRLYVISCKYEYKTANDFGQGTNDLFIEGYWSDKKVTLLIDLVTDEIKSIKFLDDN